METAYYFLNNYFSLAHWLSLLIALFVTYIFFILLITLMARTSAVNSDGTLNHKIKLIPFWSWYEVIAHHDRGLLVEIILNVVLFMPVGILGRLVDVTRLQNINWGEPVSSL